MIELNVTQIVCWLRDRANEFNKAANQLEQIEAKPLHSFKLDKHPLRFTGNEKLCWEWIEAALRTKAYRPQELANYFHVTQHEIDGWLIKHNDKITISSRGWIKLKPY
jgi:hypothetical protein